MQGRKAENGKRIIRGATATHKGKKKNIYLSMRKNKILSNLCTITIVSLLLFLCLTAIGREGNEEDGWGRLFWQVVHTLTEEQGLSRQFILLELLWKQQNNFYVSEKDRVIESSYPLSKEVGVIIPEEEALQKMREENQLVQNEEEQKEEIFLTDSGNFRPQEDKVEEILPKDYANPEALLKRFYTVDPTTEATDELLDIYQLMETNLSVDKTKEGPHILLYHTHSQETFADSRPGEEEDSIVGAGNVLASLLEEYGFQVLHHKGEYDVESRDYAYSESLPAITKILEENPQIQAVIDLHRDAVNEDTKLITTLQEKQTAKVMFFNGLSYSKEQGPISYLENPYLKENMAFSFQMKAACDAYYPGFARNIYLRAYRYNMHLHPKTLLIELGAQTNTVEEIKNALYPLAHALDIVLSGREHG